MFYYISGHCIEVEELDEPGRWTFPRAKEPFVLCLEELPVLGLVHGRQEDCRIAIMCYPGRKSFVLRGIGEVW